MLVSLALAGCVTPDPGPAPTDGPADPAATTPVPPDDPAAWTFADDDPVDDEVDLDGLSEALQVAVDAVFGWDATPVLDAYDARYAASATEACPDAVDDGLGNTYWANGCNTPDGAYFGGYVTRTAFVDVLSDDGAFLLDGRAVSGNLTLVAPDGSTLDVEGTASVVTGASPDGLTEVAQSSLVGGFAGDGADATGFLRDGPQSLQVTWTRLTAPSFDAALTVADAAVNLTLDGDTYSVAFTGATAATTTFGAACDEEPGGQVEIRDPNGRWAEVAFSGPTIDGSPGVPGDCDGCGIATVDAVEVGEVCAAFGSWLEVR
ncbi:MAG: hypothetical protein ABMB14_04280 [Myxococcota bacterium]